MLGSTPGNSQLPQARIRPYASLGRVACDDIKTLVSDGSKRDALRGVDVDLFWPWDFKTREAAKSHWLNIEDYVPRLEQAYNGWKTTRRGTRDSTLMDGAIAVARSSDFDPLNKEKAAFKIVEAAMLWWLDAVDPLDIPAFEGDPPPSFWRQVELHGVW